VRFEGLQSSRRKSLLAHFLLTFKVCQGLLAHFLAHFHHPCRPSLQAFGLPLLRSIPLRKCGTAHASLAQDARCHAYAPVGDGFLGDGGMPNLGAMAAVPARRPGNGWRTMARNCSRHAVSRRVAFTPVRQGLA
jgi:hypothetical protein